MGPATRLHHGFQPEGDGETYRVVTETDLGWLWTYTTFAGVITFAAGVFS